MTSCAIEGCQVEAGRSLPLCRTHAMMVPPPLWKAAIAASATYGPGSIPHRDAVTLALRAVYRVLRLPVPAELERSWHVPAVR